MFNPRNALFHLTACHDGTVILAHLFEKWIRLRQKIQRLNGLPLW
jgi:hypothetical protein